MQIAVQNGDTYWKFSVIFGVPVQLIADSNPAISPEALQAGQVVQIPGYEWRRHTVVAGDSLWRIASANGISVDLLLRSNPGASSGNLAIGSVLLVPQRITRRIIHAERPYTYAGLTEDLNALIALYPFLRRDTMGKSVMGKDIPELRVGHGSRIVHFNGSIHANEWITTSVLMLFLNDYLLALSSGADIRDVSTYPLYLETTLSLVPMVNPDGVNLVIDGAPESEPYRSSVIAINGGSNSFSGWKANIAGVDLNKQFPALWERDAVLGPQEPSPRDFSGTAPLTEPEVRGLADLTRRSNFALVLAFHTQGEVIYWGFQGLEPPESAILAARFAAASGYEAIRFVDSTAGYKDWFIQDWRRPGFTLELGSGINPLPLSQLPDMYDKTLGIMLIALQG
ncbi:M14 family metallopeptidase [Paenibacillus sp. CAU 1782]